MDCEILILNFDGPGDRKVGSIAAIKYCNPGETPVWGRAERIQGDRFFRIRVTGVKDGELDFLHRGIHYTEIDEDAAKIFPDQPPPEKLRFRSRFLITPSDLPEPAQTAISNGEVPTLTREEFKACIRCRKLARKLKAEEIEAAAAVGKLREVAKDPIKEIDKLAAKAAQI